jgi:hypothetical protein
VSEVDAAETTVAADVEPDADEASNDRTRSAGRDGTPRSSTDGPDGRGRKSTHPKSGGTAADGPPTYAAGPLAVLFDATPQSSRRGAARPAINLPLFGSDARTDDGDESRLSRWTSRARLLLGGLALAAGIGLVVAPTGVIGIVESLATQEVRTAAALVGGFAILQALAAGALVRARSGEPTEVSDPLVDATATDPGATPGEELDDALDGYDDLTGSERADVRDRLRATAVHVVAARRGCSRERAREAVADGRWTDDPSAAAYLADEAAITVPLSIRLREVLGAGSTERVRATRAAEAIPQIATQSPVQSRSRPGVGGRGADGGRGEAAR